jgi:signal recognition particle subunit SRP54
MLDTLTQRMARVVKTLRGEARLTEANTQEMLREVRLALLEADVALPVVREFIAKVKEKALGEEVISSLSPGQALVGVVQRELTAIIGGDYEGKAVELNLAVTPPAIILMAGLQGAGKTTTSGKLAKMLREKHKKKVLTVSVDVYRPAAIQQLKTVTEQVGADFFPSAPDQKPADIARAAVDWAKRHFHDVLIVDTAGRLGIDEAMMNEISELHALLKPAETLFVVDAMLGQDAVNTAKAFSDALPLTGVVLTKLDGDSRGGAALSVRHVTGKPIKFVGVAEKLDGLEVFHPDRMANRILGMGDILALVEEAQKGVDGAAAQKLADKVKKGGDFDLNDFRAQLSQMKKMGGLTSLMDKLPAQFQQAAAGADMNVAEKQMRRMEGIINSMTLLERAKPDLIKAQRKRRIAAGAGV